MPEARIDAAPNFDFKVEGRTITARGSVLWMILSTRASLGISNGRMTTRELVGLRTIPVRLTSI